MQSLRVLDNTGGRRTLVPGRSLANHGAMQVGFHSEIITVGCCRPTLQEDRRRAARNTGALASTSGDGLYSVSEEEAGMIAREKGLEEYKELKDMLLRRTWKFGALFSVYLFVVVPGSNASLMELFGAAAGYAYLLLLMNHVDSYNEDSDTPIFEAERIDAPLLRNLAKVGVGYRYSLNPRLLIPTGLALACFAYNSVLGGENPLGLVEEGCLLGGFLGYKVALITKVYDDLKPKVFSAEELMKEKRPDLVEMEDVDDSLLWSSTKNSNSDEDV